MTIKNRHITDHCELTLTCPDTDTQYEITVEFSYFFAPGHYSGLPEDCYPDEFDFSWRLVDEKENLPWWITEGSADDEIETGIFKYLESLGEP